MVGRSDLLKFHGDLSNPKMGNIDFSKLLKHSPFEFSEKIPQNFNMDARAENRYMPEMMKALENDEQVRENIFL